MSVDVWQNNLVHGQLPEIYLPRWLAAHVSREEDLRRDGWTFGVPTPEGLREANFRDYIIRDALGRFHVCREADFERTIAAIKEGSEEQ